MPKRRHKSPKTDYERLVGQLLAARSIAVRQVIDARSLMNENMHMPELHTRLRLEAAVLEFLNNFIESEIETEPKLGLTSKVLRRMAV